MGSRSQPSRAGSSASASRAGTESTATAPTPGGRTGRKCSPSTPPSPTPAAKETLESFDWSTLSPQAQETLRTIVPRIWYGSSRDEIADQLGRSRRYVNKRVREL